MVVEHAQDGRATARHERQAGLPGFSGCLPEPLRGELTGLVGQDKQAARRHRRQVPGDDSGGIVAVRQVVQARDEQQRDRLGEIEQACAVPKLVRRALTWRFALATLFFGIR